MGHCTAAARFYDWVKIHTIVRRDCQRPDDCWAPESIIADLPHLQGFGSWLILKGEFAAITYERFGFTL